MFLKPDMPCASTNGYSACGAPPSTVPVGHCVGARGAGAGGRSAAPASTGASATVPEQPANKPTRSVADCFMVPPPRHYLRSADASCQGLDIAGLLTRRVGADVG